MTRRLFLLDIAARPHDIGKQSEYQMEFSSNRLWLTRRSVMMMKTHTTIGAAEVLANSNISPHANGRRDRKAPPSGGMGLTINRTRGSNDSVGCAHHRVGGCVRRANTQRPYKGKLNH